MLIGFNNDVEHRGMTFHIQTEDHGSSDSMIETQLFHSGAILDTAMSSYKDMVEGLGKEDAEERIRAQMKASHRSLFKKLRAGNYDEMVGLEPLSLAETSQIDADAEDFTPSQERVPAAAQQIEEGGEEAIEEFESKQAGSKKSISHTSLNKLKSQLSALKQPEVAGGLDGQSTPEDTQEDDVALATQIMDASGVGFEFSSDFDDANDGGQPRAGQHGSRASAPAIIDFPETGAQAWTGCRPCEDELSLVGLVEDFLAS